LVYQFIDLFYSLLESLLIRTTGATSRQLNHPYHALSASCS